MVSLKILLHFLPESNCILPAERSRSEPFFRFRKQCFRLAEAVAESVSHLGDLLIVAPITQLSGAGRSFLRMDKQGVMEHDIFTPPNTAEAQKALTDALNIYDLADGFKVHRTVELPSAPLEMFLCPDGKIAAVVYKDNVAILNTETAEIVANLPAEHSALAEAEFLDEDTVIYAGKSGITAYDYNAKKQLWTGKPATSISVSANSKAVAAVYKEEDVAFVYDASDGKILHQVDFDGKRQSVTVNDSFANPNDNLFALNSDGTMLGVSFDDGELWIFDIKDRDGDIEIYDNTSGFKHFEGGLPVL